MQILYFGVRMIKEDDLLISQDFPSSPNLKNPGVQEQVNRNSNLLQNCSQPPLVGLSQGCTGREK